MVRILKTSNLHHSSLSISIRILSFKRLNPVKATKSFLQIRKEILCLNNFRVPHLSQKLKRVRPLYSLKGEKAIHFPSQTPFAYAFLKG